MLKERIYKFIVKQNVKMDYDIFSYGYHVVATYCLYLGFLIPISIINHVFLETILFIIVFVSLRQYLGGLHFGNSYVCLIFTIIVATFIPLISNKIEFVSFPIRLVIILISFLCVNLIGTVDHKNKKISYNEKKYFIKTSNKILIVYMIIELILYAYIPTKYGNTILFTILVMNFNMIIPKLVK